MRCTAAAVLLVFAGLTPCARATTYYVDQRHPVANDANPGSEALPWLTIQHAADTLIAGDTVYVKEGVYPERVAPQRSGQPTATITYSAFPGDTVTIDGSGISLPEWAALFEIIGVDHILVSGFEVINARTHPSNYGIAVESGSHVTVENNHTDNTSSSGIIVWSSDHVTVAGNEIEHACNAGAQSENECLSVGETDSFEIVGNHVHHGNEIRGEGIDAKDGSSNGLVHGNHVHAVMSVGIYVDAWNKHTYNIDVYDNVVHDIEGDAFSVGSEEGGLLENVRFFNNLGYGCKWLGLSVHQCCTSSHPVQNLVIINNTFHDNGWQGSSWGGGILDENAQATGVIIRNNLCSDNRSFQIAFESGGFGTVDHNLIDGFRGYAGETRGSDYQEGDPLFIAPDQGDLHVGPGSPAIDNGSADRAPDHDLDGMPRPQGAGFDIGAYEHGSSLIFADGFESGDTSAWGGLASIQR